MSVLFSLTKRNMKEILREPISLVFLIGLPVLMELLFYFLFHSLTPQFEMQHLAPAMIGFANAFLSLFLALLVSTDRESSFIARIYTTPVTPLAFILGYLLAIIPFGLCQSAIVLLVGGIISPALFSLRLLLTLLTSLLPTVMFAAIGILFGSLLSTKAVGGVSSIVICGQSVLSGMWFPQEGLSGGFVAFMNALPFRNISTLFQSITAGNGANTFQQIWLPILILGVYTVISLAASCFFFIRSSKGK